MPCSPDTPEPTPFDAVLDFLETFTAAEHRVLIAKWKEPDRSKFLRMGTRLGRYLAEGARIQISRPVGVEIDEARLAMAERVPKRPVLKIRQYQHPKVGELFRVYMGTDNPDAPNVMNECLIVATIEGHGMRIVATYVHREGEWVHTSGVNFGSLGERMGERVLQPPLASQLADFDGDADW